MIIYHSHCGLIFWLVILLLFIVHHHMWNCCWCKCCFFVCLMLKGLFKIFIWSKTDFEVHYFVDYYYFFYLCSSKMSAVKYWLKIDCERMKYHCYLWCSLCLSVALFCVVHLLSVLFQLYLSFRRPISVVLLMLIKHHRYLLLSCKSVFHGDQECHLLGFVLDCFLLLLCCIVVERMLVIFCCSVGMLL